MSPPYVGSSRVQLGFKATDAYNGLLKACLGYRRMGKLLGAKVTGFNRDLEIPLACFHPLSGRRCLTLTRDARSQRSSVPVLQLGCCVQPCVCLCVNAPPHLLPIHSSTPQPYSLLSLSPPPSSIAFVLLPFALPYIVLAISQSTNGSYSSISGGDLGPLGKRGWKPCEYRKAFYLSLSLFSSVSLMFPFPRSLSLSLPLLSHSLSYSPRLCLRRLL